MNDFQFQETTNKSSQNFTIVDDDILELDELVMVQFNIGPVANQFTVKEGQPNVTYILIKDDDCELLDNPVPHTDIM